tara:strand:+ start:3862 stop:4197 length:336 start_codon:yes stop_codon:yes gene_type:complete
MKYIDSEEDIEELPQSQKQEEMWFNKDGQEISGENERFYAKSVVKNGRAYYYIRVYSSSPFDPNGIYGRRERALPIDLKSVSKNTFDFYMMYLSSKNSLYMTKAQRGFLND